MRLIMKVVLSLSFLFILLSCEENFSPKEKHKQEYILNCIIDGRNEFQTATILKSFDVDNSEPGNYPGNPFVDGAKITLKYRNNEYTFKDTIMTSLLEQRFEGPLSVYYLNNFTPERNDEVLKLEAVLPDGTVLNAEATTPIGFSIDFGQSTRFIPPSDNSSYINIHWMPVSFKYFQYYIVRMRIKYAVNENGTWVTKHVQVPLEYRITDGKLKPEMPTPSRMISISYPMEALEQTMNLIEESPAQRNNVAISRFVNLEVLTFDANLAAYYYAGLSENIYTVRIDEIIYSNVEGGYGIFGVTWLESYNLNMSPSYIQRLGYDVLD